MGYDLQLLVPDAFSPNGDGINEVFRPVAVGVKTLHLRIFNRWGEMLYSSSDRNAGWDGTFEGKEVPPGAYLYTVEVKGIYGPTEHYKGMLYLLR